MAFVIIINIKPVKFILDACQADFIIGDILFDFINLQIKKKKKSIIHNAGAKELIIRGCSYSQLKN